MILGVNGRFLGARATGVQRFAGEVVRRVWGGAEAAALMLPHGVQPPGDLPSSVRVLRGRSAGHAWERRELPAAAREAGCDVVLHPANTVPSAGGPHVVVLHDVEPLLRPQLYAPPFRAWYRWIVAPAVRRAAAVLTGTRAAAAEIEEALGIDAERIAIVAHGVEPFDRPAEAAAVAAVGRRFALSGPYLLAVGGGDPRKNVGFLRDVLAAWPTGRADFAPPPQLVVVSGGVGSIFASDLDARRRAAGELSIGRVDDETLRALYTGAAALAFPSLSEGFGRPPLEALACGAPVVVAPYRAAAEVLGDAVRIVPLSAQAWVRELGALLSESEPEAVARRERGFARAAAHTWDEGAATVLEVCRGVAAGRARWAGNGTAPAAAAGRPGSRHGSAPGSASFVFPRHAAPPRPGPSPLAHLRVALVHDWLTGMRGGEKVLEALLELFPRADVFALLHVPGSVSPAIEARRISTSFVQRLPDAARRYRSYLPLFPRAIESFDLTGYDLVLSSSHCVAKGAVAPPGVPHLCYCHTPMRYIWDQADAYLAPGRAHPLVRAVAPALIERLRRWDRASAAGVDAFVANSAHVRERVRRCWGREAAIVHPPVEIERFRPAARREDFYLIVSALVPYKRIDLAIEAVGRLGRPLVVAGSGPELDRLRALAPATTRFTGWASDAEISDLMGRCRALLMPGVEDFGIVPVEAQAAGAPVIALGQGGALETVIAGDGPDATGVFFAEPSVESLVEGVLRFERRSFDLGAARANAARFGREIFLEQMRQHVGALLDGPAVPGVHADVRSAPAAASSLGAV